MERVILLLNQIGFVTGASPEGLPWDTANNRLLGSSVVEVLQPLFLVAQDREAFVEAVMGTCTGRFRERSGSGSTSGENSEGYRLRWSVCQLAHTDSGTPATVLVIEQDPEMANEELRTLSARIVKRAEEERRKLAREVHDELGQTLTLLKIDLEKLAEDVDSESLQPNLRRLLKEKVASMERTVVDGLHRLRRTIVTLRPPVFDELGLVDAARWLTADFSRRIGIRCTLDAEPMESVPQVAAFVIFRVLQECLTNVARHARASRVMVKLRRSATSLELLVTDNGVGFDVGKSIKESASGILGMKERVLALGGSFEVHSAPEQGTTVSATLPLLRLPVVSG